ncbi:MAG: hypothetical protein QOJ89_3738 [bacterium]|jgi:hypothetical protein
MPHGQFTNVSMEDDDTLLIEGLHEHELDLIRSIQVAVIAVADHEKRVDAKPLNTVATASNLIPDNLLDGWGVRAPAVADNGERFKPGDEVIAVGATDHLPKDGLANPIVWFGAFRIQPTGGKAPEVHLCVE